MQGDNLRSVEAQRILRSRDARYLLFPSDIFDEYAWNMMLHLFVSMASNQAMDESRLIALTKSSNAVGRRWIKHLVADGQVQDRSDSDDVLLTSEAIRKLRIFFDGNTGAGRPSVSEA